NDFLSDISQKTIQDGKSWAAEEYIKARGERNILIKEIASSRKTVVAANSTSKPPIAKVESRDILNVARATKKYVEASTKPGWSGTPKAKDAPEFVIVLEPIFDSLLLDVKNNTGGAE
ncbi:MAG: hypothetical protein KAR13_21860, partial [Desulfobulbaceae bacterium]|nr:hypothetical protein [Desulfobulbaceae bacterium]